LNAPMIELHLRMAVVPLNSSLLLTVLCKSPKCVDCSSGVRALCVEPNVFVSNMLIIIVNTADCHCTSTLRTVEMYCESVA
jgi:hypothetical protein